MIKISIALILISLSFNCSKVPMTHFYLIDYPITLQQENSHPVYDVSLGIARFNVDPLYADGRIVYRENFYEGNYYHYHRWITDPGKMITDKIIEQFNASRLFKQVVPFPRFSQCDYILNGNIKTIEEWDEKNLWLAKVKIEYELIDNKTKNLLWNLTIESQNPVANKSPFELVSMINKCVQQNVEEIQQRLSDYFASK